MNSDNFFFEVFHVMTDEYRNTKETRSSKHLLFWLPCGAGVRLTQFPNSEGLTDCSLSF